MEEYKGEGLRGPGWTIAGVEILRAAKEVLGSGGLGGLIGGGCRNGGGGDAAAITAALAPAMAALATTGGSAKELAEKDATIARLMAERYSDNAAKEQADRLLVNYLKPYGDEIAAGLAREAKLQAEIDCLKQTTELKFQLAEQKAQCCCDKVNMRVDCIETKVNAITKTMIPSAAVEKAAA
jgi:hypothetical protein